MLDNEKVSEGFNSVKVEPSSPVNSKSKYLKFLLLGGFLLLILLIAVYIGYGVKNNNFSLGKIINNQCTFKNNINNFSFNIDCSWSYSKKQCEDAWGCSILPSNSLTTGPGMSVEIENKDHSVTRWGEGEEFAGVADGIDFSFQDYKFHNSSFDQSEVLPWRTNNNNIAFYKFKNSSYPEGEKYCTIKDTYFICLRIEPRSIITENDIIKIVDSFQFNENTGEKGDWTLSVYDLNTNEPIANAQVEIEYYRDLWNGCSNSNSYTTNQAGEVSSNNLKRKDICNVEVKKDGYIINGAGEEWVPRFFPPHKKIHLKKITTDQRQYNTAPMYDGDGINILDFINNPIPRQDKSLGGYESIQPIPKNFLTNQKIDMKLESIGDSVTEIRLITQVDAGIQEITDSIDLGASYDEPYRYANLVTPPQNNYKKEIIISQNKRYILRLRDGKTYVKFSYDMSTNSSNQLYASFYLLSFNKPSESESKPSNNVSAPNTQEKEITAFPNNINPIFDDNDWFIKGMGFLPESQIYVLVKEVGASWTTFTDPKGNWQTSFGDMTYSQGFSTKPTTSTDRTISIQGKDFSKDITFKIDSSLKKRVVYFAGLELTLPSSLIVERRYNPSNWVMEFSDKDTNRYQIAAVKETYQDYFVRTREMKLTPTNIPGIFKQNLEYNKNFLFYDPETEYSYEFGEFEGSKFNWSLEYFLSLIDNEKIQTK